MEIKNHNKQPSNPTNEQRHILLKDALERDGRIEDYYNIIKLLRPPPDILNYAKPGEFKQIKVGIIGGGLAGMSAAFELRKLGFDITIFDALEDRVGGRVYTYYFDESGGNVNLPIAFYKSLTSKKPKEYDGIPRNDLGEVTWKGGSWVRGIYKSENGKGVIIKYQNKNLSEGVVELFDYVICAIPFSTLSTVEINPVFSNRKMQAIREINYVNGQRNSTIM